VDPFSAVLGPATLVSPSNPVLSGSLHDYLSGIFHNYNGGSKGSLLLSVFKAGGSVLGYRFCFWIFEKSVNFFLSRNDFKYQSFQFIIRIVVNFRVQDIREFRIRIFSICFGSEVYEDVSVKYADPSGPLIIWPLGS